MTDNELKRLQQLLDQARKGSGSEAELAREQYNKYFHKDEDSSSSSRKE